MKKLFITAMLLLSFIGANAQGKIINLDKKKDSTEQAKPTGDIAIYQGKEHPIYVSKNGKYYILVISKKTGNVYKKYLKNV